MKPFFNWVGGKTQLLAEIKQRFPAIINNYYEPFIGGGAVLLSLTDSYKSINVNDLNSELTNTYESVRDNPEGLMSILDSLGDTKEEFTYIRNLDREPEFLTLPKAYRAARFIYLTKRGFNGLYRVNSKGYANMAYGLTTGKGKILYDENNLLDCSKFLKKVVIRNEQFDYFIDSIEENDFVYLDPPYEPASKTSDFKQYINDPKAGELLDRLINLCDRINQNGARFMLSNSDSPVVHEAFKAYNIDTVQANRTLNCDSTKRGKVNEVLITNYQNPYPIDFGA